jgi:hypothetical protein
LKEFGSSFFFFPGLLGSLLFTGFLPFLLPRFPWVL